MMAGVPGFDPSDPGAYANRTTGDGDMHGYGGSPALPDAKAFDYAGLASQGLSLIAAGEAPPPAQRNWQAPPAQAHRPDGAAIGMLNPFVATPFSSIVQTDEMLRRRRLPLGLLGDYEQ